MFTVTDRRHMDRALALARRGLYSADPNPRVGCVLVKDDQVVGEGWHRRTGEAHAEVNALRVAGPAARGATAYVTLEPCCHHGRTTPCTDALLAAGVSRVVAAMVDPDPRVSGQGLAQLRTAGVEVECGLRERQARELNVGFVARLTRGRPWLRLKLAMSLDGRTAMASGESQWITGPAARADVHRWRARSSAVLAGAATVLADDPALNVRLATDDNGGPAAELRQPLRVILDPQLRTPPQAHTLSLPGGVLLITAAEHGHDLARRAALAAAGAEIQTVAATPDGLDLNAVAGVLAARDLNELHVEAGARLAGALFGAGLVDELLLYVAPKLLGSAARGLVELPGVETLADGVELELLEQTRVGPDWRIVARPKRITQAR